ncbi:MAG: 23S rRNA (adenine(2503)-C(2))-methyltransferase RlmN [Candidatus Kapaibacteriales bacterium]
MKLHITDTETTENKADVKKKKEALPMTLKDWEVWCQENDEKSYRAEQIFRGIYSGRAVSFDQIATIPTYLRAKLDDEFTLRTFKSAKKQVSIDGSVKFLFTLEDGKAVESVFMPWHEENPDRPVRTTLCISSQIGCAVDCAFCATGKMGFGRNMTAGEIIEQVLEAESQLGEKVTNLVFMGMGEPLLNHRAVFKSIELFTNTLSTVVYPKKITVSTSGITKNIDRMVALPRNVKLAVSLHATTNGVRDKIMPINQKADIGTIMDAVENYYRSTKLAVTYEYIPFAGLNDTKEDAKRLAKICKRVPSRVNIIPFNDISFTGPTGFAAELKPSSKKRIYEFANEVRSFGGVVTIRDTFGSDIDAACGQLALSERTS